MCLCVSAASTRFCGNCPLGFRRLQPPLICFLLRRLIPLFLSDISKTRMRVITKAPFGASNSTEMMLEASHHRVKERWLHAFKQEDNTSGGFRSYEGELLAEGYLTKVQPVGTTSKTRWFVLTDRHLGYYKEEGHDIMGNVALGNITVVTLHGRSRNQAPCCIASPSIGGFFYRYPVFVSSDWRCASHIPLTFHFNTTRRQGIQDCCQRALYKDRSIRGSVPLRHACCP